MRQERAIIILAIVPWILVLGLALLIAFEASAAWETVAQDGPSIRPDAMPAQLPEAGQGGRTMLIDDFSGEAALGFPDSEWSVSTDRIMGERSRGRIDRLTIADVPLLRLSGEVVAKDGAGFILASLDLRGKRRPFDAGSFDGIRLAVRGNGETYALHLSTPDSRMPWQFYQAVFPTSNQWQVVSVPFSVFQARSVNKPLDTSRLTQIQIGAGQRSHQVDVQVAGLYFYEEWTPAKAMEPLNPQERAVIENRGTERAFTGEYDKFFEAGEYICRRCGAPLYRSDSKFDSGCGWPAFDDSVPGAVLRLPDADGYRTEIVCANCGGHLGHVFYGEGFTETDTRHCVNSISMRFVPHAVGNPAPEDTPATTTLSRAIFASGCFWGTEYFLQRAPGVVRTRVGFTGGHTENPTYAEVCTGLTGHAEAVEVLFDPSKTTYEDLARLFFETHDFTQVNRQGPDIGTQYRGEIFTVSPEQEAIARKLIRILEEKGYRVATRVSPAGTFHEAEDYHQDYYLNIGGTPYCHAYRKVF